jgi:hypothetical protein
MIHRDGNVGFPGGSGVSPLPLGGGLGVGVGFHNLRESHLHPLPFLLRFTGRKGGGNPLHGRASGLNVPFLTLFR